MEEQANSSGEESVLESIDKENKLNLERENKNTINEEVPSVNDVPRPSEPLQVSSVDARVHSAAEESDLEYRQITKDIVQKTSNQLEHYNKTKGPLREDLVKFIQTLLVCQFVVLCLLLVFNNKVLGISDNVVTAFIVSIFVETLAGLMVMIRFAFDSVQEVELIKILNSVVKRFQKFSDEPNKPPESGKK